MPRRSFEQKIAILRRKLRIEEEGHFANGRRRLPLIEVRYRNCLTWVRANRARNSTKYLHNIDGNQIMDTLNFKGTKEEMLTIITRSTPGWPGPDPQPTSSQWLLQFASYPKVFQGNKYREVAE
jgi:hypothetical protein